jgi:hypothetical protein
VVDSICRKIIDCVAGKVSAIENVEVFDRALTGTDETFTICVCRVAVESETVSIIFNIPKKTPGIFFGMTWSNESSVVQIVANLEDYELAEQKHLHCSDAVRFPEIEKIGEPFPFAVLLMRTATSPLLSEVPDTIDLSGRSFSLSLAIPINEVEHSYRAKFGHDALMDRFEQEDKDITF